jgi:hypothetical protein
MQLNTEALMSQATEVAGLEDFGDPVFQAGLRRLVDAINKETIPTELGKLAIPGIIVGHLVNRLKVEDWYRRHPEIEDEVIRDPVFITGLPRTGSTALGHMLGLDAQTRCLRGWEGAEPCPPPDVTVKDDPRIARHAKRTQDLFAVAPGIKDAIPTNPEAPDECAVFLQLTFVDVGFNGFFHIPDYEAWAMTEGLPEMDAAYRYHRRVLKLLQWRTPAKRWQLRCPLHALHMGALLKSYPDARFVITHRHPEKVLPSICSLIHHVRQPFLANPSTNVLGPAQVNQWQEAMRRLLAVREQIGGHRFFDLYHREQAADPQAGLRRLYAWLGWEFSDQFADRLGRWREDNPQGVHKPDPAMFGLDLNEVRQRFSFYTDQYGARM